MLSDIDSDRIEAAVARAEEGTSGEIIVVLAAEVSKYREIPLAWAAAAALALPPLVVAVSAQPLAVLVSDMWVIGQAGGLETELNVALGVYAVAQIAVFLAVLAVAHIPAVRRRLTPAVLKRHRVAKAAWRQFAAIAARAAGSDTGVMVFVALADHQVQVVADAGIHAKCGVAPWTKAAQAVTAAMKAGADPTAGIIEAVDICGAALREHYPPDGDRPHAFSNRPVEV
jgi:putative membrane protein